MFGYVKGGRVFEQEEISVTSCDTITTAELETLSVGSDPFSFCSICIRPFTMIFCTAHAEPYNFWASLTSLILSCHLRSVLSLDGFF